MGQINLFMRLGILAGCPGSMTDTDARDVLNRIKQSGYPKELKVEALKALWTKIENNHAHGRAADVLREVEAEMDKL